MVGCGREIWVTRTPKDLKEIVGGGGAVEVWQSEVWEQELS